MKRDLAQAADIHRRMLPEQAPKVAGLDLAGYNSACRTVGGDYFDFFTYADGRVALLLADVSGKGMPAALMMTRLQAHVQSLLDEPDDLGATMARINQLTCDRCPANRFITLFLCRLDPATGEVVFANAGHNPPVLVRASGEAQLVEGGGPVLGILPAARYSEMRLHLDDGDMLVLYSDFVTEAGNPDYDEFGEERLRGILQKHRAKPAAAIVEAVTNALAEFTAGAPQADDITLVVARRTK
jgi:sigma-B regulation protein RsbU (phosphoserine phosphatase)